MQQPGVRVIGGAAEATIVDEWSATLPLLDYGRVARHSGGTVKRIYLQLNPPVWTHAEGRSRELEMPARR